jgi:mono/diheme cytochrome c family protein
MRKVGLLVAGAFGALALLSSCVRWVEADDTSSGGGNTTQKAALPCGVADVVQFNCLGCHGAPTRSGAPQPLLTAGEWKAPSFTDPSQSNGQLSIARMNDPVSPMPPSGMLPPDQIAIISDWVTGGMEGGDCLPDTPLDPALDAMPTCTSNDTWPAPQTASLGKSREQMFPGVPCIDCHDNPTAYGQYEYGPLFDLAGTVFPSAHEPDDCSGVNGAALTDVAIHIEDSAGGVWDLHPNQAGNFFMRFSGIVPPYAAKVISANGVRAMSLHPTIGDCNLCHTQNGSSGPDPNGPVAPGRITVPSAPQP